MAEIVGAAGRRGGRPGREGRGGAGLVPDAAVEAFAERSAGGALEQPPVFGASVSLQVLAEEADKLRRDRDRPDRALRAEFEAARLAWRAVTGPGTRGAGKRRGQRELSPASRRQVAGIGVQGDGFGGAQRRVVQAAEERGQLRADPGDLGQDRLHLGGCGGGPWVHRAGGSRGPPGDAVHRIGGQQAEFCRVAEAGAEDGPLAGDGSGRRTGPVQAHGQGLQSAPGHLRVSQGGQRQRVMPRPGQRSGGRRAGISAGPARVERLLVEGSAQHRRWWPAPARAGESAIPARVCAAACGHFMAAYAAACSSQVTVPAARAPQRAGSPVPALNSRPRRAARMSSAR